MAAGADRGVVRSRSRLTRASVLLSPPMPGAHWQIPLNVLAGPFSLVWLVGQMVCIGVAIYLAFKLKIS